MQKPTINSYKTVKFIFVYQKEHLNIDEFINGFKKLNEMPSFHVTYYQL